jgi:hypothetical protein
MGDVGGFGNSRAVKIPENPIALSNISILVLNITHTCDIPPTFTIAATDAVAD